MSFERMDRQVGITLGSLSHVGMQRSGNEDSYFAVIAPNAPPGTNALIAVADGMGGHQAGEVASSLAVQGIAKLLSKEINANASKLNTTYGSMLEQAVSTVNAEIHKNGTRPETKGMGTTLTASLLVNNTLYIAHVGDSRAYLLREAKLAQITQDHSWVAEAVTKGILTPDQAKEHPNRNVITRALGQSPTVQVDITEIDVEI